MILECYNLLKKMEPRPAMWTGEMTLKSIDTFISGYYMALSDYKIVHEYDFHEPFFDWVANKLGYSESTAGWVNMIVANTIGLNPKNVRWEDFLETPITQEQHSKSVKFFYELVEQFKNEIEHKYKNTP